MFRRSRRATGSTGLTTPEGMKVVVERERGQGLALPIAATLRADGSCAAGNAHADADTDGANHHQYTDLWTSLPAKERVTVADAVT